MPFPFNLLLSPSFNLFYMFKFKNMFILEILLNLCHPLQMWTPPSLPFCIFDKNNHAMSFSDWKYFEKIRHVPELFPHKKRQDHFSFSFPRNWLPLALSVQHSLPAIHSFYFRKNVPIWITQFSEVSLFTMFQHYMNEMKILSKEKFPRNQKVPPSVRRWCKVVRYSRTIWSFSCQCKVNSISELQE